MHVVVIVEFLEKFASLGLLCVGELGKLFGHITQFARHNRPAVCSEPFGDLMHRRAFTDEKRAPAASAGTSSFC